ncbi:hypothetical protein JCM19274_2889 [Algibacter lectus]|uniref:Uncharacterized protein n=1 Tax=Algibacter lectus TaxID=221126 RepID=A0A090WXR7_9FLAO|nr:hypothetical protein JCM19274_2889 [Algibacter lectus]
MKINFKNSSFFKLLPKRKKNIISIATETTTSHKPLKNNNLKHKKRDIYTSLIHFKTMIISTKTKYFLQNTTG